VRGEDAGEVEEEEGETAEEIEEEAVVAVVYI